MTDEQTAAAIVADPMNAVSETAMEAAIVRALQQARSEAIDTHANAAVLRMCHEARMCNGIVDYSDPNATGVVRRVVTKSIGPIAYPTGDYVHVLRVEASWEEMSKAAESAKEAKK
jgi:hypothetical protein